MATKTKKAQAEEAAPRRFDCSSLPQGKNSDFPAIRQKA